MVGRTLLSSFIVSHKLTNFYSKTVFRRISRYTTAQTSEAAYIIGGSYTKDIVAEYKDDRWRDDPWHFNQGRYAHGSITIGGQTMIIGGMLGG